jgi:hypothetical protein
MTNLVIAPPKTRKGYQIPMSVVLDTLRSSSGDWSRSALDHLHLIEDRCMLFKLAKISEDEVKRKLL